MYPTCCSHGFIILHYNGNVVIFRKWNKSAQNCQAYANERGRIPCVWSRRGDSWRRRSTGAVSRAKKQKVTKRNLLVELHFFSFSLWACCAGELQQQGAQSPRRHLYHLFQSFITWSVPIKCCPGGTTTCWLLAEIWRGDSSSDCWMVVFVGCSFQSLTEHCFLHIAGSS